MCNTEKFDKRPFLTSAEKTQVSRWHQHCVYYDELRHSPSVVTWHPSRFKKLDASIKHLV